MHIEIAYADGTTERLPVKLDGFMVMCGPNLMPGHVVGSPARCCMDRDYFEASLGEGRVRSGSFAPADPDGGMAFSWSVVGDEDEECRAILAKWDATLGEDFDPDGPIPVRADASLSVGYESDQRCWWEWLDDPAAELEQIRSARAMAPR